MRKLIVSLAAFLLVAAGIAALATGCGTTQSAAQAGPTTPGEILNAAITTATPMTSGAGQFDVSLAVNGDTSKMPAEAKAILGQPISITGTIAAVNEPLALDLAMTASFAGQNLPLGFRAVDGKAWVQLMGQWYEAPPELAQGIASAVAEQKSDPKALLDAIKAAGIDPQTWITGLTTVGEDDLEGTKTYHLSGSIDINKLVTDGLKIAQDENLQRLIPGMSAVQGTTPTSLELPGGADLQSIQTALTTMFQNLIVDIWVTKDGYQLRKAELNAKIVPPPVEDAQGIESITVKAGFSLAPATSPVAVTPPAEAKPASELEKAFGGLEELFSGMLGG